MGANNKAISQGRNLSARIAQKQLQKMCMGSSGFVVVEIGASTFVATRDPLQALENCARLGAGAHTRELIWAISPSVPRTFPVWAPTMRD